MYFFAHSINSIDLLNEIDMNIGIEIDIRDQNGKLVLGHDPLQSNYLDLKNFLINLKGRNIIANIKSERVEKEFIGILKHYSPNSDYFFLDSSFSMIANFGNVYNFASRFSEYESIETTISLLKKKLIKWIWVDTFTKLPINEKNVHIFNSLKAKKCLTSPDLLGRVKDIEIHASLIKKYKISFDAICCKKEYIKYWQNLLK